MLIYSIFDIKPPVISGSPNECIPNPNLGLYWKIDTLTLLEQTVCRSETSIDWIILSLFHAATWSHMFYNGLNNSDTQRMNLFKSKILNRIIHHKTAIYFFEKFEA